MSARASGYDDLFEWVGELTVRTRIRRSGWAEAITYAALARASPWPTGAPTPAACSTA